MSEEPEFIPLRDITRIKAEPGDTLLFRLESSATIEDCQRAKEFLAEMLPEINIVVATGVEGVERIEEGGHG